MKYKCIIACPHGVRNYNPGDVDEFDEPMNPEVWEPLEGEPITNAAFIEYCRKKHVGELEDAAEPDGIYNIKKVGRKYEVVKIEDSSVVRGELSKKEAQALISELTEKGFSGSSDGEK